MQKAKSVATAFTQETSKVAHVLQKSFGILGRLDAGFGGRLGWLGVAFIAQTDFD